MKLIYLIAGTYRAAGMERVLALKANWLARHGHDVLIVTTDQRGREPAFRLEPSIRCVDLGIDYEDNNGGSFLNKLIHYPGKQLRHRSKLKALICRENPHVIVSMFCNDAGFVPAISNGAKTVLEIHFSRFKRLQYGRKGLWALSDRMRSHNDMRVVSRFDRFVVLTHEDAGYWGELSNLRVIPNARTFVFDTPSDCSSRQVLAVGRYDHQKDFAQLLEIWKMVLDGERAKNGSFMGWKLRIAGSGELQNELLLHAKQLGIEDSVIFGVSTDMKAEYQHSSILAMTSRFEGLPMVLLEAQAAGLPVVSYACKCGPKDVLTDGGDGFLVEQNDIQGFAEKLTLLMKNNELRRQMGQNAYKASDRFAAEPIMETWDRLFRELLR